ncbi:MAG: hypothetical protein EOM67_12475, partial [Spirochaetia bacterium]|nr:hypothetical protein [Spirochaetia bacterium]
MLYRVTLLLTVIVIAVVANIVPRASETSAPEAGSISEDEIVPCVAEVVAEEPPVTTRTEIIEEVLVVEEPEPEEQFEGVLVPSNLTADELRKGLLYELKEYAEEFIQAEKETGINAVFLSSVAALESGWGRSDVSVKRNNLFGWTASSGYKVFDSKEECIS